MESSLKIQIRNGIDELTKISKQEGKNLSISNNSKTIFIGKAFESIILDTNIAYIFQKELDFIVRYRNTLPITVLDLIYACNGIRNLLLQLNKFQKHKCYNHDVINYAAILEQELSISLSYINSKKKQTFITHLPFCALCYKRTFRSYFYCENHSSNQNKDHYKKAKSRLFNTAKQRIDDEEILEKIKSFESSKLKNTKTAYFLYTLTAVISPVYKKPIYTTTELLDLIKAHYPLTSNILNFAYLYKQRDIIQLAFSIVEQLDKDESVMWKHKNADLWINHASFPELSSTVINFISRYEATLIIANTKPKFGPNKGTGEKKSLRESITALAQQQLQQTGKINQSEIARSLNLSRQRINVIIKTLHLDR